MPTKAVVPPSLDPELPVQRVVNADVGAPPPVGPAPSKIFYSPVRELYIAISPGQLQTLSNGTVERMGEKFVRFQPLGDMYGIYKTNDPEIIQALEQRMVDARAAGVDPDVLTETEYSERHMTDEVKLDIARREIEQKNRLIIEQTEKNRLLLEQIREMQQQQGA